MAVTNLRPILRRADADLGPFFELAKVARSAAPGFLTMYVDGGAGTGGTIWPVIEDPGLRIIAYEPLPENISVLEERFGASSHLEVRATAVSDSDGVASFEIPSRIKSDSGYWVTGTSFNGYLQRPTLKSRLTKLRNRLRGAGTTTIRVRTVRLDEDLDRPPDMLKLDLQGAEPSALRGLGNLLSATKMVQAEVQLMEGAEREECVGLFEAAGLSVYLGDAQFSVPAMTDRLRELLAHHGVQVERENSGTEFDPGTTGFAHFAEAAPFVGSDLSPAFAALLRENNFSYFQVDLIALNQRAFPSEWAAILESMSSAP